MNIGAYSLIYNFKRNRERFAALRDELLKAGHTDAEIAQAMADAPALADALGRKPQSRKVSARRRKDAAGPGAAAAPIPNGA